MSLSKNKDTGKKLGNGKKLSDKSITLQLQLSDSAAMLINIGNCQSQGARDYQEDSFGYSDITNNDVISQKGMVAVLSDGMGGLTDGKAVSDYVVQAVNAEFASDDFSQNTEEKLRNMVLRINSDICARYLSGNRPSAGATAIIMYINKNRLFWATVGDSRIYCLRNGNIFQLNEDHDYKNVLYRNYIDGSEDLEIADTNEQGDNLVGFIGKSELTNIDVNIKGYLIRPDDVYILCSDGIYNGISMEVVKDIILNNDAQTASEKIVENIENFHLPGQDNMTVMVIKCSKI